MLKDKYSLTRVRILVKAYPQPSKTYGETVCVAAITEDGERLLRLYPVRFRRLGRETQFSRFDLVEMRTSIPRDDNRPESCHVDEDSIRVIEPGSRMNPQKRVELWMRHISPSLWELQHRNRTDRISLGIIKPDSGSVKFSAKPIAEADQNERNLSISIFQQQSFLEAPLNPLKTPEFVFSYRFTSDGHRHNYSIQDWEVQAAWLAFKAKYGDGAIHKLQDMYETKIPRQNLHFILGTMKAHPATFILIGLLRSTIDPLDLKRQAQLF